MPDIVIRSPKQGVGAGGQREKRWYPYYAGYAQQFVDDILAAVGPAEGATVVDPWNGSGTTTARAAAAGYEALGIDANPVLVLVARGRVLGVNVVGSLPALTEEVVEAHARMPGAAPNDPLRAWFKPAAADRLRRYDQAIQHLLVEHSAPSLLAHRGLDGVSSLASFMFVALFATTRQLLSDRRGTNPTWMRSPKSESEKAVAHPKAVRRIFREESSKLAEYLSAQNLPESCASRVRVDLGGSETSNLGPRPFELLVGSPPYCTRIDYAIATAPELAVIGLSESDFSHLRNTMIGTPTIKSSDDEGHKTPPWGELTDKTLNAISTHESKASATYYRKYYVQYFESFWASLCNISSQASSTAKMCLVVQDSYYKDVHVDLPAIVREMAECAGWRDDGFISFELPKTKAAMNPRVRKYRGEFSASEDVLFFSRANAN